MMGLIIVYNVVMDVRHVVILQVIVCVVLLAGFLIKIIHKTVINAAIQLGQYLLLNIVYKLLTAI
jgi:hypothetical protein